MTIMPPAAHNAQPPSPIRGTWGDPVSEEAEKCRARRARVLAHPDIAKRLCDRPLNYPAPEFWTGYIPSATIPGGAGPKPNTSPIRKQLLAICRAVADAEKAAAEGGE